jgi:hypothetical protein
MDGVNGAIGEGATETISSGTRRELRLFDRMPAGLDLRDEAQLEALLATADALLARSASEDGLLELECALAAEPERWPLAAQVAVKLARSKAAVLRESRALHLSVVFAAYAEHERMLQPWQHALGEGVIDRKLRQLEWLLGGSARRSYELMIVDDGCPHGSGRVAESILSSRHPGAPARVAYLADAINEGLPAAAGLSSVDESRKGGSILHGMWLATRQPRRGQVVLYTDADLSTHLGQAGLLVEPIRRGALAAIGSRRASTSVVVKSGARSDRGRLFIYLWKHLLPELEYVTDTQCGFKAFPAPVVRHLVGDSIERGFAFDLELLMRIELLGRRAIAPVPIAWIDSEAASTTRSLQPYLGMLRAAVQLSRTYRDEKDESEPFAKAIEALDEGAWDRAVELFGPRVAQLDPGLDCQLLSVSPDEIQALAA